METKKNGVQAEAHTKEQTSGGHAHSHTHVLEDGTVVTHTHTHSHEHTKAVLNRLSRAIGHLESIKKTGKVILQDHIQHCLVDAIESGDMKEIEELNKAIDRFIK